MIKKTIMLASLLICTQAFSEDYVEKKAGVAFRFDDNHSVKVWKPMIEVFDKHGLKAGLSINPGWLKDNGLPQFFKQIQENGHEIMNHTPYHRYYALPFPDEKTAQKYSGKPGVDHVNKKIVCFKYTVPETVPPARATAKANIIEGGKIKFEKSGYIRGYYTSPFYIKPYDKKFYLLGRKTDKDGYYQLHNLWREPVKDAAVKNDAVCVFESSGVRLTPEAFMIEGETAHAQFAKWGIKQPVTWIHPGCGEPGVNVENIKKSYGDKFNYKSGAVYINSSAKVFNEYDPDDTRRFAMQWGNFRSEAQTLEQMKTIIADSIACNRVAFDASHMHGSKKLGGQEGYLKRIDALLAWLKENKIPVRTQSEWADILYQKKSDPKANAFPSINTDLDKNGRPDGIFPEKNIKWIKLEDGNMALESSAKGMIFKVNKLAGLEKGINKIVIDFKAEIDAKITIDFAFNIGGKKVITLKGNGEWQQISQELDVPEKSSFAYVGTSTNSSKPVIIKNISLSK